MKTIKTAEEMIRQSKLLSDKKIGFVPTMGGIHEGHLSLVERARAENDVVVASVYLNPTQFNDRKDLETYPADFEEDREVLEKAGTDIVFFPSYEEIYPDGYRYRLTEDSFSKILCGEKRPGHFDGVLTVVMKLLNIVRPANAYFGEKDFQQYRLVKGMAEAFFLDVNIIPCPTVRQKDGLALSSRNRKLSGTALTVAPKFHDIISSKKDIPQMKKALSDAGFTVDYISEVDGRLYAAVFLEGVRLIDGVNI